MSSIQELLQQARSSGLQLDSQPTEAQRLLAMARSKGIAEGATEDPEQPFWSEVAENFMPSVGKRFEEIGDFAKTAYDNPRGILSALGSLSRGMGQMGRSSAPDFTDPDVANTLNAVDAEVQSFKPENIRKDPTRPLANIATMAAPFAGVGGRAGTLSRVVGALDPVAATAEGLGALAKGTRLAAGGGARVTGGLLGETTGANANRGMAMVDAGRRGGARNAFRAMRGRETPNTIGNQVVEGFGDDLYGLSRGKKDIVENAGSVDISGLKQRVLGDVSRGGEGGLLSELRISVVPDKKGRITIGNQRFSLDVPPSFRTMDEGKMETLLMDLLESPDQVSAQFLDEIKQGFDNNTIPKASGKLIRAIDEVRGEVRGQLGDVPGFNEASDPIRDFFKSEGTDATPMGVEPIQERLGLTELIDNPRNPVNRQRVGERVAGAFNKGPGVQDKMQALEEIDRRVPGTSQKAAGLGFQGWAPTEIVGRGAFFSALGGLGILGKTSGEPLMTVLVGLPAAAIAFSPQVAGSILLGLGLGMRGVDRVSDVTRALVQNAERMGVNTKNATIGQLLERMEQKEEPSLLGAIGATRR